MAFELPELDYEYNALEPFIDEQTMKIHHTKHHQAYVDKLNDAVKGTEWENKDITEIIANLNKVDEKIRAAVRNHGGGHLNHSMFWKLLKKDVEPTGELVEAIKAKWGSLENFKTEFKNAAMTRFGSGWAWLVLDGDKLEIVSTGNQDNPITDGKKPIIGIDVWEHAYYIRYQNRRPDYIDAFLNIINWEQAEQNYKEAKGE